MSVGCGRALQGTRALPLLLLAASVGACSAILGIHDGELEGADSGARDSGSRDADGLTDAIATDDARDSSIVDSGADTAPLPNAMVKVPGPAGGMFEVDTTEVTQEQYADFLARGTTSVTQPPECSTNTSFTPHDFFTPQATPTSPVVMIDWCDAYAYCAWVGKRLCGGVGGAPGAFATSSDPTKNEWLWACTKGGVQDYPYGAIEQPAACNVHSAKTTPDPVPARAECAGGYPGISDMVGNATEWVNECDDGGCAIFGGSFSFPPSGSVSCKTLTATGRGGYFGDLSFRCCR